MAKDSVEQVREAEQRAQQIVADARREAVRLINEARAAGQRQHDETLGGARTAAQDTIESAREDGVRRRETDKGKYAAQGERLRKQAESKREQAIKAVIAEIAGA